MRVQPETVYDTTHSWQNDRVEYARTFYGGTYEQSTCAQALITANPLTSNREIAQNMNTPVDPPRTGYQSEPLTIEDVLYGQQPQSHIGDAHTTDFSGKVSGRDGTSIPTIPMW